MHCDDRVRPEEAGRRLHLRRRLQHGGAGQGLRRPGLSGEIVAVISDKADAGGLEKARALGIEAFAIARRDHASKAEHEAAILSALAALSPDLICLAGYMRLLSADFIAPYEGRIINIHPSLLPLFPGLHTHQRAIDAGHAEAGCTVHFVTEGMDEGPGDRQTRVPLLPGDTADTLAARVLTAEHATYRRRCAMWRKDVFRCGKGCGIVRQAAAGGLGWGSSARRMTVGGAGLRVLVEVRGAFASALMRFAPLLPVCSGSTRASLRRIADV